MRFSYIPIAIFAVLFLFAGPSGAAGLNKPQGSTQTVNTGTGSGSSGQATSEQTPAYPLKDTKAKPPSYTGTDMEKGVRPAMPITGAEGVLTMPAGEGETGEKPAEVLSSFEQYVREKGLEIDQFGYGLFNEPPSTFAPVDDVPVGPDYILGPGDELRLVIWGKINGEYTVEVDRDGNINFPQIGILHLSGLTFSEAKAFLDKEMSRYYQPSEVKMNVSMGSLRSIRVFVVGKAKRPGSYTLSSLSTLVNALFAAGGPGKVGSMRDIQVKRGGQTITRFDLYDFLLKGDKTKDIRLTPEDVIFIPPIGPLAGISGDVNSPAIYELKGGETAGELIGLAGGLNADPH